MYRFLQRLWRNIVDEETGAAVVADDPADDDTRRLLHRTIDVVRTEIEALRFNTAIAKLIELNNHLTKRGRPLPRDVAEALVLMVSPFAPHIGEELWRRLGHEETLAYAPFPVADPALLVDETVEYPVQVNGKVRGHITVPADASTRCRRGRRPGRPQGRRGDRRRRRRRRSSSCPAAWSTSSSDHPSVSCRPSACCGTLPQQTLGSPVAGRETRAMVLSAEEARVLACLIEKETTVPDSYPLTLNALRLACNQSTNRDPIVAYDDRTVETALLSLKSMGLLRFVHPSHGGRTIRYRHVADERWRLSPAELGVLAVLVLRGPQTVGEVRTRAERHLGDGSTGTVEEILDTLAARSPDPFAVARRAPPRRARGPLGARPVRRPGPQRRGHHRPGRHRPRRAGGGGSGAAGRRRP